MNRLNKSDILKFDQLWKKVDEYHVLPSEAIKHVPDALSPWAKKRLIKHSAGEVVRIVYDAIEEVNNGSVESVDELVRKRL